MIFTSVVGRSGQFTLANIFNTYGIDCYAEAEPPQLIITTSLPLKSKFINKMWGAAFTYLKLTRIQRRWLVSNEDMGRGKALEWYEKQDYTQLDRLAGRNIKRVERLQEKKKYKTYICVSKYFLRTQCEAIYRINPDISLIKLTRDPLMNAKSSENRKKFFLQDNPSIHSPQNCLKMDGNQLNAFQLYLWSWCEMELRHYRFVENHPVKKIYEINTEELNNTSKLIEMFSCFGISHREIKKVETLNTNVGSGRPETVITEKDINDYEVFVKMVPKDLLNKILYLNNYDPYIHIHR